MELTLKVSKIQILVNLSGGDEVSFSLEEGPRNFHLDPGSWVTAKVGKDRGVEWVKSLLGPTVPIEIIDCKTGVVRQALTGDQS